LLRSSCGYLRHEGAIVPLRLIPLLRSRRTLLEQSARPLVIPLSDRQLRLIHPDLIARFRNASGRCLALRNHLCPLERKLGRVNETDDCTCRKLGTLDRSESDELTAGLRRDRDFIRLKVAIGVGPALTSARRRDCDDEEEQYAPA
jgi:hypothetical protein